MSKTDLTLQRVFNSKEPALPDLAYLLELTDKTEMRSLFDFANHVRREYMGEGILLRGVIEFSNFCKNSCQYCGLNKENEKLQRYRMKKEEILVSAAQIKSCNIKTVVLQSGECDDLDLKELVETIKDIKTFFGLAVTLSIGERSEEEYKALKKAGADRYLLKIETSNKKLYESLHPGMSFENRLNCLKILKQLEYQVGSGNIIGLKGQTLRNIIEDLMFFRHHDFDMIGIGPFIPHSETALNKMSHGDKNLTLKVIALTRILTRNTHIPATTALGSLEYDFRPEGLKAGANVLMPNFTPLPYKKLYEIYPGKKCIDEPAGECAGCMELLARTIGRSIDYSVGDSKKAQDNV